MRAWIIGLAAFGLASCGEEPTPDPAPTAQPSATSTVAEIDPAQVTLKGDGLVVGPEAFYFAAGKTEVEAALTKVLGKPADSFDMPECGAGPMQSASFEGGLTVNFQDGKLVGWFLRAGSDNITLENGPAIGAARADAEQFEGFAMIEGSTLGDEFFSEPTGVGGFFNESGAVSELYAGTQCFFR